MNQAQTNTNTMHKAVAVHFEKNKSAWQTIKPIAEEYALFLTLKNKIEEQDLKKTKSSSKGLTSNKDAKLNEMLVSLDQLIKRVRPYAKKTKNEVLLEAIDYSKSDFRELGQEKLFPTAQKVVDAIKAEANNLVDYKIDAAYLAQIQDQITTTEPLISERDNVADQSSTLSDSLTQTFKKILPVIKNLDDLVESLIDETEFISTYKKARITVDRGGNASTKEIKKIELVNS